MSGRVALVGAGPGDAAYLTLRALEVLREAEVVLIDRLVADGVRAHLPATARIVEVGKQRGGGTAQAAIVRRLVREARAGRRVVRLKGGDPYVFGRGGEEALALAEAGITVELVPGISAALAAPALAGIPVTHRGLAASVCVLTAEESAGARTDWRAAAAADTVVLLMGVDGLEQAAVALIAAGKDPSTPAAIVQEAGRARQRVLRAPLRAIASRAQRSRVEPPATIVIGPTVALDLETVRPAATGRGAPLAGRRILVTRAEPQAEALAARIRDAGGEPVLEPAIRIVPGPVGPLRRALAPLADGSFDWIVWTSANGVDATFEALRAQGLDARALAGCSIAVIGPATADRVRAHGLEPDLLAAPATSAGLAKRFPRGAGSVLLPRADLADAGLATAIAAKGWLPLEVVAYRIADAPRWPRAVVDAVRAGRLDLVLFASAGTAHATARQLHRARLEPSILPAACIGPVCAQGAVDAGFEVRATATEPTLEALVAAAVRALR